MSTFTIPVFVVNAAIVALAVMFHYEVMVWLSVTLGRLRIHARFRLAIGIVGALLAHVIETWIFAVAYFLLIKAGHFGAFTEPLNPTLMDCAYFSIVTYSSLGYGDMVPVGEIRFLAGMEALTGLVLIAMSASFMYFELWRDWTNTEINKEEK